MSSVKCTARAGRFPEDGRVTGNARAAAVVAAVSAQNTEQREVLHAVLANLPDRQREAIVLRFFEELSVEETAAAMNCAEGTVKATVHQALRSMRQKLPRSFSPVEPPVEV